MMSGDLPKTHMIRVRNIGRFEPREFDVLIQGVQVLSERVSFCDICISLILLTPAEMLTHW